MVTSDPLKIHVGSIKAPCVFPLAITETILPGVMAAIFLDPFVAIQVSLNH